MNEPKFKLGDIIYFLPLLDETLEIRDYIIEKITTHLKFKQQLTLDDCLELKIIEKRKIDIIYLFEKTVNSLNEIEKEYRYHLWEGNTIIPSCYLPSEDYLLTHIENQLFLTLEEAFFAFENNIKKEMKAYLVRTKYIIKKYDELIVKKEIIENFLKKPIGE